MSNLKQNTESLRELISGIENLPEDGYYEGYDKGKAEGRVEGEQIGYQRGYAQGDADGQAKGRAEGETIGFADALAKRTELVVTDSGEYVPEGESTGFKKVTVGIQKGEDLDGVIAEQAELIEELSATLDEKIGAYDVGYDAALEKLTDLVVTENGDYAPEGDSTGFKTVSVNVQAEGENKLAQYMSETLTELAADDFGGATKIKASAFYKQRMLKSVTIANSVTQIGNEAFSNCKGLESVALSENCPTIPQQCFYYCEKLPTIVFPSCVSNIQANALSQCTSLKSIIVRATTPPTLGTNVLYNCKALEKIAVPIGSGDAYKAATNWSAYADKIAEEAM